MKGKWNVLIIGAGRMGAFSDNPGSESITSLAHGFSYFDEFNIAGFVDSDGMKAQKAAEIWGGEGYSGLDHAFGNRVDVVCIAVPDKLHYKTVIDVLHYKFELLILEKPISPDYSEAEAIEKAVKASGRKCLVNYTRRFLPEFRDLSLRIQKNEFGGFITGNAYYDKGLMHNGSHMIDLIRFLLGDIIDCRPLLFVKDFYDDDPSISSALFLENSKAINLMCADCRYYTAFELDLLFEKQRVRIVDFGRRIEYFSVKEDDDFDGYLSLSRYSEQATSYYKSAYYTAECTLNLLKASEGCGENLSDSLEVLRICRDIRGGIEI